MLVSVFCENNVDSVFDEDFLDCLPKTCPDCGMPMEMSETLTGLHCSNVRCPSKVIQRLVSITNALGVKDFGEARAEKFIYHFGITNPLNIFAYEPEVDGAMADDISLDMSKKIADQFREKNKFTLAEFVKIANLPNVQMSAFDIFGDFDDLSEAYAKIETGGVEYIRDKLNIKDSGTETLSVRAIKVYESLMTYKDDLFDAVTDVEIIKVHTENMKTLKAVCSDEVGSPFRTKAEFYATCNNSYPNVHIEFGNSVTKKTDFLVWAGADGSPARLTNKAKKAKAYQEKGVGIKIVTAMEFLSILTSLSEGQE